MRDDDLEALRGFVESVMSDINTSMPGEIVSYDPDSNRAIVRPLLPKRNADGTQEPAPQIFSVPVSWPAGNGGAITFPLKPGDGVNLHFSQRALDGWLSGGKEAPSDPRQFDLTDATATPGTQAVGIAADPSAARWSYQGSTVRLTDEGTVEVKTAGGSFKMDASGKLTINAPGGIEFSGPSLTHNGVNIGATHRHREQGDGNLTGVAE